MIIALACAGLGSVAAGLVVRTTGHAGPATADRVAPWGKLAAVSPPAGEMPAHLPEALRPASPVPASAQVVAVRDTQPAPPEQAVAAPGPDLVKAAAPVEPVTPAVEAAEAAPAVTETRTAAVETPAPAAAVGDTSGAASVDAQLDINTASMAALNSIQGAGRIGRAIVSHRPYRSLGELTSRRVLRSSDFARVKGKLKV